jgi:hypothetical protein
MVSPFWLELIRRSIQLVYFAGVYETDGKLIDNTMCSYMVHSGAEHRRGKISTPHYPYVCRNTIHIYSSKWSRPKHVLRSTHTHV